MEQTSTTDNVRENTLWERKMLINKTGDMTPFDRNRKPVKQNPLLLPIMWGGSWICTRGNHLKISRDLRGIKPPFLVFSTHQGFSDYYIAPLALFPHRANYVSDMEGFAAFGEWLYRNIGCIGKRRYVADLTVPKHMKYCLDRGNSVVLFPESRHSNAGITAQIPENMGRLAKMLKVPVVTLSVHGSYLAGPFWDEEHPRKVPLEAELKCLYTAEELEKAPEKEVQEKIWNALQYNEYAWQKERGIRITEPDRALGLHKALYQCRCCGESFHMKGEGKELSCEKCGSTWELTEYGDLKKIKNGINSLSLETAAEESCTIPDWYEWQRGEAIRQMDALNGPVKWAVTVEALPSEKGFVSLGKGELTLTEEEFILTLKKDAPVEQKEYSFKHKNRESVQTEYNYRGKGEGIVLSTLDCCYYIYPACEGFSATWLQFAGEEYYRRSRDTQK